MPRLSQRGIWVDFSTENEERKMTCINIETGTEGPTHDPYGWEEMTVKRPNGDKIIIHQGLGTWVKLNDVEIFPAGWPERIDDMFPMLVALFEEYAGCTYAIARKAYDRYRNTCQKCGGHESYAQSGYPGETMYLCLNCDTMMDYHFNIGAVI